MSSTEFKKLMLVCFFLLSIFSCKNTDSLRPIEFEKADAANYSCPEVLPNTGVDVCALYQVPLNWHQQNDEYIDVFLRAFHINKGANSDDTSHAKGQIWIIDGGPGASGATFSDPDFVNQIHAMGFDLYIPTHRGVGFSSHLNCSKSSQNLSPDYISFCATELLSQYGENLSWFSAIGAAHDLNYLIKNNNPENLPVILMGASYGTFVAQRFIQLFDEQIEAAVLISGANLSPKFEQTALLQEATFQSLLELCDTQYTCNNLFADTPHKSAYAAAEHIILGKGWVKCETTNNYPILAQWIMGNLAASSELRAELAITIKRILRCNKKDKTALQHTITSIKERQQKQQQQLFQFNSLLLHHQIFSELMSQNLPDSIEQILPKAPLMLSSVPQYVQFRHLWPKLPPAMDLPKKISSQLPVLTMHGGLDMQAPKLWFSELEQQLNKETQFNVLFHQAGHGTPNYTKLEDDTNCSWLIVESFVDSVIQIHTDPASNHRFTLDTNCNRLVKPFEFITENGQNNKPLRQ